MNTLNSQNLNIAYQVRAELLERPEISLKLRGLPEANIKLFVRKGELQKLGFNELTYNLLESNAMNDFDDEEDEFVDIPHNVYKNLCLLIYNEIKSLKMDLDCRTILIGWKYDSALEQLTDTTFGIESEYHFRRGIMQRND